MNFSETFIRRPIATSLLMAAIALFALSPIARFRQRSPQCRFPTLLVSASLPEPVPRPWLLRWLHRSKISSPHLRIVVDDIVNSLGSTQITLEFDLNRSLDGAAVDVQGAITQPRVCCRRHAHTADIHQGQIRRSAYSVPAPHVQDSALVTLDEYGETQVAKRISMISGWRRCKCWRAEICSPRAEDPHSLASHQVGLNEVEAALEAWNVNLSHRPDHRAATSLTLQASGS